MATYILVNIGLCYEENFEFLTIGTLRNKLGWNLKIKTNIEKVTGKCWLFCTTLGSPLQWRHNVIMSAMATQILKSSSSRLFSQPFVYVGIKENIKDPRHWRFWGEYTGDSWIPRTKSQWREKYIHLITSPCLLFQWSSDLPRFCGFVVPGNSFVPGHAS